MTSEATMVERVARALFGAWAEYEKSIMTWENALVAAENPADYPKMAKIVPMAYAEARAAIAAMREPTEEMIEAGVSAEWGKTLGDRVAFCWQAMLDAALSPTNTNPQP